MVLAKRARQARTIASVVAKRPREIRYVRSLLKTRGKSTVSLRVPWLPFDVIRLLADEVLPTSRVFEFGGGGSTAWFADRAAAVDLRGQMRLPSQGADANLDRRHHRYTGHSTS
jgi:hypothetical protein